MNLELKVNEYELTTVISLSVKRIFRKKLMIKGIPKILVCFLIDHRQLLIIQIRSLVVPWSFPGRFPVVFWSFHGRFTVVSRSFHGHFTVVSRSFDGLFTINLLDVGVKLINNYHFSIKYAHVYE